MIRLVSNRRARKLRGKGVHVWWDALLESYCWSMKHRSDGDDKKAIYVKSVGGYMCMHYTNCTKHTEHKHRGAFN